MALPSESPTPAYAIRRFGADDERGDLFRFIQTVWGPGSWHANQERWEWQFLGVPTNDEPAPPLWILTHGDQILGQVGAIPVHLSFAGTVQPAAWASDLIIDPEYWNRGGFPLLMREFARGYPIGLVLGMNMKCYGLFQRSKDWLDLGVIPRLERYCSLTGLASARTLVALVRQSGSVLRALVPRRRRVNLQVHSVPRDE